MRFVWLFLALALTICVHAQNSAGASPQTWSYKDYGGEMKTLTLNDNQTVTLSDLSAPVALSQELDVAFTSGELKTKVTADYGRYPVYSVTLSKDAAGIEELRKTLNEMHDGGALQFSGDELCPEGSDRTLTLLLRDVPVPFTFCLKKN